VGHRLGLATRTQSVSVSRHFLLQAPQCPCSVRKRFSRDHCCRGRSKPGSRIVGSHTRWELTTWANFQLCLHRLLMSSSCYSVNYSNSHTSVKNKKKSKWCPHSWPVKTQRGSSAASLIKWLQMAQLPTTAEFIHITNRVLLTYVFICVCMYLSMYACM